MGPGRAPCVTVGLSADRELLLVTSHCKTSRVTLMRHPPGDPVLPHEKETRGEEERENLLLLPPPPPPLGRPAERYSLRNLPAAPPSSAAQRGCHSPLPKRRRRH